MRRRRRKGQWKRMVKPTSERTKDKERERERISVSE